MLRHDIMKDENFFNLSAHSTKLLIDLISQFNGKNNGDLCAAWSLMEKRGWRSKGTLYRSIKELLNRGWISTSRQGGKHKASLYALTWLAIDFCGGKLDVAATSTPSNLWKNRSASPNEYQSTPHVYQFDK